MRSSTSTYIPRIDHLRFFAVLLVFVWHAAHSNSAIPFTYVPSFFPLSIFDEGHTGVSLFLTLSGFIFASLAGERRVRYGAFIRNRLLRVLPLLFVWTLINFAITQTTPERLLAQILTTMNRGDFPGAGWTVIVEFQLYLVFPFFLRFVRTYGPKYLVGVVASALLLRAIVWAATQNVQFLAYWTVLGRVDEFVLGMLGFEAARRYGKRLGNPLIFGGVAVAWLLIMHRFNQLGGYYFGGTTVRGSAIWIYLPTLEGLFYATLTASYLNLPFRGSAFFGRIAAWIGAISYSIYLNHAMVVQAFYAVAGKAGVDLSTPARVVIALSFFIFPILLACSALTYYVIELPFLRLREKYLDDPETPALAPAVGPG
jgi:peptidoglycan/LPS O-acetylase OafA/YrhL